MNTIQHALNSLHILALLVRWGVQVKTAKRWARRYEGYAHPWLYGVRS